MAVSKLRERERENSAAATHTKTFRGRELSFDIFRERERERVESLYVDESITLSGLFNFGVFRRRGGGENSWYIYSFAGRRQVAASGFAAAITT